MARPQDVGVGDDLQLRISRTAVADRQGVVLQLGFNGRRRIYHKGPENDTIGLEFDVDMAGTGDKKFMSTEFGRKARRETVNLKTMAQMALQY
jgi:hypothetical protein